MMASLVSCMRRAWGPARRMLVAVLVAVGVCVVCVHAAFADHPAPGHQGRACSIVCVSVFLFERIDA